MSTSIKFENISKQYRLGLVSTRTLSHDLNRWWTMNIRGKDDPYLKIGETNDRASKSESEYIWALRDINLEVEEGEVLGIIGKNGAGKSTLLKILSKVTTPTTGSIKARGRIASLLEVGTGFHPEMTGRENIYMNGAIMGMTRAEIRRKFDEIVDFAGVERYIDTPVKRYSSGMTVRLGFAVAAHLEPEILVVDEVLAVGDAEFQKKAIGKMQDVSRNQGRTVLFVSHNMGAVKSLCNKVAILQMGEIINIGEPNTSINSYMNSDTLLSNNLLERRDRQGNQKLTFHKIEFLDIHLNSLAVLFCGKDYLIRAKFTKNINDYIPNCRISLAIYNEENPLIILSSELVSNQKIIIKSSGYIDFIINNFPLSKGVYYVTVFLESNSEIVDWVDNSIILQVEDGDFFGLGKDYPIGWDGKTVLVKHNIEIFPK